MGTYINPKSMTKEQWLRENASAIVPPPIGLKFNAIDGQLFVCHINAGGHTAALVITNRNELTRALDTTDRRPRQWYSVPIDRLNELPDINIEV